MTALTPELVAGIFKAYRVPPGAIGYKIYAGDYPMANVRITPAGRIVTASHWWQNQVRGARRMERREVRDLYRFARVPSLIHNGGKP